MDHPNPIPSQSASGHDSRMPVVVLTGFLGSGKTTLLATLLRDPDMPDTAVIVDEFGQEGLDHHLLERPNGETVLLASGCICCAVRSELAETLAALMRRRANGKVPAFSRMLIETTGLAQPSRILETLMSDSRLSFQLELVGIVTTVDAIHGMVQFDEHAECMQQVAVADRIVVTKVDCVAPRALAHLRNSLVRINPTASLLCRAAGDPIDGTTLLAFDPACTAALRADRRSGCGMARPHGQDIESHVFRFERPLDWVLVSHWLGSLSFFHGDRLLRLKGVLNIKGECKPMVVHAVRHVVHEPWSLGAWPDDDRRSRVVVITRGLARREIEAALERAFEDTFRQQQSRDEAAEAIASPGPGPDSVSDRRLNIGVRHAFQ